MLASKISSMPKSASAQMLALGDSVVSAEKALGVFGGTIPETLHLHWKQCQKSGMLIVAAAMAAQLLVATNASKEKLRDHALAISQYLARQEYWEFLHGALRKHIDKCKKMK